MKEIVDIRTQENKIFHRETFKSKLLSSYFLLKFYMFCKLLSFYCLFSCKQPTDVPDGAIVCDTNLSE